MGEKEFIETLRKSNSFSLEEGYKRVLFYAKSNGYDLIKKCKLLRQVFTDNQVKMLTGE